MGKEISKSWFTHNGRTHYRCDRRRLSQKKQTNTRSHCIHQQQTYFLRKIYGLYRTDRILQCAIYPYMPYRSFSTWLACYSLGFKHQCLQPSYTCLIPSKSLEGIYRIQKSFLLIHIMDFNVFDNDNASSLSFFHSAND